MVFISYAYKLYDKSAVVSTITGMCLATAGVKPTMNKQKLHTSVPVLIATR